MKYIDIHGHINSTEYDADREEAIARAKGAGVGIISVGTDLESSRKCVALAEAHDEMWATIGIHPTDTGPSAVFEHSAFRELAKHPKVVAIGECGLDYMHSRPEDMDAQRELFKQHIALANEIGKPLMLHVRNAKSGIPNAYAEALEILRTHAKVRSNFHFFAGTLEDMNAALEIGCSVSFTGVLTFARSYDEFIKKVPLERIMSETDCPFVTPIPYRGKRNEPSYVIEVVKAIAKIRGEDEGKIADQLLANAKDFFAI